MIQPFIINQMIKRCQVVTTKVQKLINAMYKSFTTHYRYLFNFKPSISFVKFLMCSFDWQLPPSSLQIFNNNMKIVISVLIFALSISLCASCSSGCEQCNNSEECLTCNMGYYLQENTCKFCPQNCLTCTSNQFCTDCIDTFYSQAGACLPCQNNCQTCSDSNTCLTCFSNFYITPTGCRHCPQLCSVCDSSACYECAYGAYMLNSQCTVCDQNCQSCKNGIGCVVCREGYYASGGHCLACTSSCDTCNGPNSCTACPQGTYLQNEACISCSQCSDPAYCNNNGICQSLRVSSGMQAQSGPGNSGMSSSTLAIVVSMSIIGSFLIVAAAYMAFKRCKGNVYSEGKDFKGTDKTIASSHSNFDENEQNHDNSSKQNQKKNSTKL